MSATSTIAGIKRTFKEKGGLAMRNARKMILLKYKDSSYSSQALRYLSKVTLHNALPVFPALVSMAYEAAVGGDVQKTTPFGEALLIISFAADLHDDVIDQSLTKGPKQTVLGKFNAPTAILAGDILLVEGLKQLTEAAESLPKEKSKKIFKWVSEAVFEICTAEALQLRLKNKQDLTPIEYYEVIRLKAVVPELCMKIGAILGTKEQDKIEGLAQFGRIYGVNSIIIEEFADLLTIEELKNRLKNECPPLPMIYATQNPELKKKLNDLLISEMDKNVHKKVVDAILNSPEVDALQKLIVSNALTAQAQLPKLIKREMIEELENLLLVPLKYFES